MKGVRTLRRLALPTAISVVLCAALLGTIDLSAFNGLSRRIDWHRLPELVGCVVVVVALFGARWRMLLDATLDYRSALVSTAVGLAGNQVLPARGGDVVRIVLSARAGVLSPHRAISALLVEKVIDLAAAALIGLAAVAYVIRSGGSTGMRSTALATAGIALAASLGTLLLARSGWLTHVVRTIARTLRIAPSLYRHAYRPLFHLGRGARLRKLAAPVAVTLLLWVVVYSYFIVVAAAWIGVHINFAEAEVLVFAAALGLAIPAAPSGIGTFHAAIVSAFVLAGRSAAEGIVVAVALHGVFAVGYLAAGLVALPFERRRPVPVQAEGAKT